MYRKQLIKDLIYINKQEQKSFYFDKQNIKALEDIKKDFFKKWNKLNLSFQIENTIFYIIGDYVQNKYLNLYENDIIKKCSKLMEDDLNEKN